MAAQHLGLFIKGFPAILPREIHDALEVAPVDWCRP